MDLVGATPKKSALLELDQVIPRELFLQQPFCHSGLVNGKEKDGKYNHNN